MADDSWSASTSEHIMPPETVLERVRADGHMYRMGFDEGKLVAEVGINAVRELAESIPKEKIERQDKYHWNGCERLHVPCFAAKILEMINDEHAK